MEKQWKQWQTSFSWVSKSLQMLTAAMKWKNACSLEEKLWQTSHNKKQRHYYTDKGPSSQSYSFSSFHVEVQELYHKESWALKNWCFWTDVLEKTLESSLDFQEIKPVNPKGIQTWIFNGRIDAEAEAPILRPPDEKSHLIGKDPDVGKDWRQEEIENEMFGWHHQLDAHESEYPSGIGDGQGSLECSSPWGLKESDPTEWLHWTDKGNRLYVSSLLQFLSQKSRLM